MKVILLTGKARNGKDATADIICEHLESLGKSYVRKAYGDYVKEVVKKYYNWDGNKDAHGRELLQKLGTDIVREKLGMNDLWVNHVVNELLIAQELGYEYGIITDCRFRNEIHIPQEKFKDSVTLKIERIGFESNLTQEQLQHRSETELSNFEPDIFIQSEDGLDNLKKEVMANMEMIL